MNRRAMLIAAAGLALGFWVWPRGPEREPAAQEPAASPGVLSVDASGTAKRPDAGQFAQRQLDHVSKTLAAAGLPLSAEQQRSFLELLKAPTTPPPPSLDVEPPDPEHEWIRDWSWKWLDHLHADAATVLTPEQHEKLAGTFRLEKRLGVVVKLGDDNAPTAGSAASPAPAKILNPPLPGD